MIGQRFGHYRILRQLGVTRAMKMIKELAGTKLDVDGVRVLQQSIEEGAPVLQIGSPSFFTLLHWKQGNDVC